MTPDDPRHGTNAGFLAHKRAGQDPCPPCVKARYRHNKGCHLRRVRGEHRRVPLGQEAWQVIVTAPRTALAEASGVHQTMLSRYRRTGPETIVLTSTRDRILRTRPRPTTAGVQRRLRALAVIGYSAKEIADRAGIAYPESIKALRRESSREFVRAGLAEAICRVFDELHMVSAPSTRASVRLARMAVRQGWVPPLAWDDIDYDPEPPRQEGKVTVAEEAEWLARAGVGWKDAASRLGYTHPEYLERALYRAGRQDLITRLKQQWRAA